MPELLEKTRAADLAAGPLEPDSAVRARPRLVPSTKELFCVRVALAVVAVHTIDDAFLNKEPGTSMTDHLASGLIPLGLLALLAWGYPRCRAWWQSTLDVAVGLLALVNAIGVSGRHVVIAQLGGDDLTGLLAGV